MDPETLKLLRPFTFHGVSFSKLTETGQAIGTCPFTDREEKFYVNVKNMLWDSKTAGTSGNLGKFLYLIAKQNQDELKTNETAQKAIAANRGIPRSAFIMAGIGFNGESYTIPVKNGAADSLTDLRIWKPGGKILSTPTAKVGLFGYEQLADRSRKEEPVYICEGEHDAIALNWLLRKLEEEGIVVGVPGADTFKPQWIPAFKDRDVIALYDADEAGDRGELKCYNSLKGSAATLRFIEWPAEVPSGFDIRDWVKYGAIKLQTPRACWRRLQMLFTDTPRKKKGEPEKEKEKIKQIGHVELFVRYRKWLHLRNENPLAIVFGSCLANRLEGDPLWIFIVAPPGGMKSELIMTLSGSDWVESISSLTPHALVSGANMSGGEDPSLIPKLDGKVLAIKDFTTILQTHPSIRDEIFGQLRDCYDGKFEKLFGNGVCRRYESQFGIVAGVTPSIDAYSSLSQGLGERFLKYRMEDNIKHFDEEERILKAIENVNHEVSMRKELTEAARQFLSRDVKEIPKLSPSISGKIVKLAMLVARMRGVVNRDKYNSMMVLSKSSFEIGTRLAKQFTKVAIGVALYFGLTAIDEKTYGLVCEVALGSAPDRVQDVVKVLALAKEDLRTRDVFLRTDSMTQTTVYRTLQDLAMVGAVKQVGTEAKNAWALSPEMKGLVAKSEAYRINR